MATELGVGYVTVLPSMRGFGSALNNGIASDVSAAGDKAGSSFGSRMVGALGTVVKGASIGATIFGGLALKSGLDRLTTIQNATQSLTTIMGDASKAAALMGEIKKTVQGTPFNLDQFADAGKNLVAMNIAGSKVPAILTAIGDAAATSGKGAEGVSQLVDVFGKMAAQGQVSLDQIWSISATGVPALQILANGFHTTTADMKEMISSGAVPAGKAIDILTTGIENGSDGAAGATIAFAGSMAGLRQTFTGAFGGMKAAVARFGAAVLSPFIPLMTNSFTATGKWLDQLGTKVTPVAEKAATAISGVLTGLMADPAAVGVPLDTWATKGAAARAVLDRVKDGLVGVYQLLVNGDFTGAFSRAFGVEEDSPVVDYMLKIHDGIVQVGTAFRGIDFSSFSTALAGVGTAFSSFSGILSTAKDGAANLKGPLSDLGSALGDSVGGGAVIAGNLLHVAADGIQFFADHTTLATAAILAIVAAMAGSGPVMEAYRIAYVIRTPLMVASTAVQWANTLAIRASTAATLQNTGVTERGTIVKIASRIAETARTLSIYAGVLALEAWTAANAYANGSGTFSTVVKWGMVAAQGAWNVITAIGTGVAWAFGAALRFMSGPIGWIVTGIALLVAGLVWFFTKTELGHKIITAVWTGIKAVVGAVVGWFVNTAWPMLQAVWEGIAAGATWLWENVLSPVFGFIADVFRGVGIVASELWTGYISPIFQLIGAIAMWLWNSMLSVVFSLIKTEWNAVATAFSWAWDNIISPTFNALGDAASWLWDNVLSPVFGWIGDRWSQLTLGMKLLWDTVLSPTLDALGLAFGWVWDNVLSPVFTAIGAAWSGLVTGIKWAWDTLLSPIFGSDGIIAMAIGGVKTAFDTVVSGIKTAWDKIQDIAKVPVKFVVNDVINGVFIKGFNKLAGVFGTDPMKEIELPAGFATGGPVRGPGSGRSDSIPAMLSNGEYVVPADKAAVYGPHLEAMRAGVFPRYYADGGFVGPMFNTVKAHFSDALLNSGYRPGANDYHGKGQAIDIGQASHPMGGDGTSFLANVSQWITDTFGAKSAEIIYDGQFDNRPDVKNGRSSTYDAATAAAHHNHVHWALNNLDALGMAPAGASDGGGGGILSSVMNFLGGLSPVKWLENKVTGVLGGAGDSPFAKLAVGLPKHLLSLVVDKFKNVLGGGSQKTSGGTGLDTWIAQAMGITHVPAGWAAGLRTIIQRESGGNPMAINETDSNARNGDPSRGLMQTIGATFERYRDKSLVDDIYDPVANIVAGINYIKSRYGDIANVQQANPSMPPKGYDQGGWLPPGNTLVTNRTGKPEPVFNPAQWAQINAAVTAPAAATASANSYPEVHVFIGDKEITDIVRTEMTMRERQSALDARAMGV